MGTEMEVFKNSKPAQAFTGEPVESLAEGIGSSYPIISYRGKVWALRYRGERHTFTRPDDGTPVGHIDVIILRKAKNKSKSYYEKFDQNNSEGSRPICSSLDGITPDSDIATPQAHACAICPRNQWITNAEGRKSRECADFMRLAVLLLPSQTKAVLGSPLMEPAFLRVPAASLNNLAQFGETMAAQGWPMHSFVTRIRFDPEKPHAEFLFSPLQALTDAEAPVINPLRLDPNTIRIIGEDKVAAVTQPKPVAQIAQQQPQQPVAPPPPPPPPVTPPPPPPAAAPIDLGLQGQLPDPPLPPKSEIIIPQQTAQQAPQTNGSILDLTANPEPAKVAQPAQQTVLDTGEPEESDAALDARIAGLLKL